MKSQFLKLAGVKSEAEFYKRFPSEEAFFQAYPEAQMMKDGGNVPTNPSLWSKAKSLAKQKYDVYPCVPLDAQALTKEGWKSYHELTVGEEILSYNQETRMNEWTPILALQFFEDAPLIRLYKAQTNCDIKCTPNHKWVLAEFNSKYQDNLVEAKDITKRMQLLISAPLNPESTGDLDLQEFSKTDSWVTKVLQMSVPQLQAFFASGIVYDGNDKGLCKKGEKRTYGFSQKNKDHGLAMEIAAVLLGYRVCSIQKKHNPDMQSWTFITRNAEATQNLMKEEAGTADVWCPTTKNQTWVMKQNGYVTITGNSAYANGWAAKWYKEKGGGWKKAEMGMEVMADGGTNNPGFKALPEYVQAKILSNMAQGGEKMPAEIARARFAAAGNIDKMDDYGYASGGVAYPYMQKGGAAKYIPLSQEELSALAHQFRGTGAKYLESEPYTMEYDAIKNTLGYLTPRERKQLDQFMQTRSAAQKVWEFMPNFLGNSGASSLPANSRLKDKIMRESYMPGNNGYKDWVSYMESQGYAYGSYIPEMAAGGAAQQAAIAIAMKKAGKKPKGMAKGGQTDPDGEMALGQIDAMINRLSNLRKFITPDTDLEPWISDKLSVMNHSATAVDDYYSTNPEAQMMEQEGLPMEQMRDGGIPTRYKNMGFNRVGQKKNSTRPGKKWMVLAKKGDDYKVVHGGYDGMKDYTQHGSEKRRDRFWNRMGGRDSAKAKDPFSPLYWHKRLGTWDDGGQTPKPYKPLTEAELSALAHQFRGGVGNKSDFIQNYDSIKNTMGFLTPREKQQLQEYMAKQSFLQKAWQSLPNLLGGSGAAAIPTKSRLKDSMRDSYFSGENGYADWVNYMQSQGYAAGGTFSGNLYYDDGGNVFENEYFKEGGIHINPKNKGKFTASATRAGMGVQEFAAHVLANKEDYSSTMVKRANFARNATKFKHAYGGELFRAAVGVQVDPPSFEKWLEDNNLQLLMGNEGQLHQQYMQWVQENYPDSTTTTSTETKKTAEQNPTMRFNLSGSDFDITGKGIRDYMNQNATLDLTKGAINFFTQGKKKREQDDYVRSQQMTDNLVPLTPGTQGDYSPTGSSYGMFRPNNLGAKSPYGMYKRGGEYELTEQEIQQIVAMGGEIEFIK